MAEFDLVVRSGTVVDGTGAAPWRGDVAICSGVIAEVGDVAGSGRREIDADGLVVTPGFVDIHTHYDGQAVWDNQLQPSSWHGVTTAIAGNCGVGFAPVRAEHRDKLIELMEGVEDIPGTALHEGLTWEWSSFSEYLDVLGTRPRDIDLATQVPHSPLRFFAMGERAVAFEQATEDEIEVMASLAREAILAGALGFSTDRFPGHKTKAGVESPTHGSGADELASIAAAVGRTGTGVLQYVTDFADYTDVTWDFSTMRRMVAASGRPLSVSVVQGRYKPQFYRQVFDQIEAANAAGLPIRAQVAARAIGMLLGLECSLNPFMMNPVWESIARLPVAEQARRMSDPQLRTAILAAQSNDKNGNIPGGMWIDRYDTMYALTDTPDYEPDVNDSLESIAARSGCTPEELAYDALVADEGKGLIYQPFSNYADGSLDAVREMLVHPHSLPGLSDGGAHVGAICDGSFPTTMLQHWVRERPTGRLDLPFVVKRQSRDTARAVGLLDRGELRPGYKADLNVIDMTSIAVRRPAMAYDLPTGGRRLVQRSVGYRHTIVSGVETYHDGAATGDLPGKVVRGPHAAPAAAN